MENTLNLKYNSQKENLVIAEYGRHVQNLINHAITIEDKEERQKFTEGVIYLMFQMSPSTKNLSEVEEKLWKHAYRISGYKLDVTPPEGIDFSESEKMMKPEKLDYPHRVRRYRHYGGYIQDMITKAENESDPEKQREFVELIGSYLKLAQRTWNKEHYANDEMIRSDLKEMTGGKYDFVDEVNLDLLAYSSAGQNTVKSKNQRNHKRKRNNKNNNNNKNRKRRR